MRKIKKLINNLKIRYYEYMMAHCIDAWDQTRLDYPEHHEKCLYWIRLYDKYENKLHKLPIN